MDENKELLKAFERRLQIADSLANLGCAWAVVSLLGRDGFWFQRLLFSVTPSDDRLLLSCQIIATCAAALVAERYRGWPLFHSLPRSVGVAACGRARIRHRDVCAHGVSGGVGRLFVVVTAHGRRGANEQRKGRARPLREKRRGKRKALPLREKRRHQ